MKESYTLYKYNLNQFYRPVFEQIEAYVCAQSIDETTREDRLGELLDVFLNAQSEGKSVHKLVGNDIDRFCKNFCDDFDLKSRIRYIMRPISIAAWLLFANSVFEFALWLTSTARETGDYNVLHCISQSSLTTYLLPCIPLLIVILVTNMILRRLMLKKRRLTTDIFTVTYLIEGVILGVILMLTHFYELRISCPTLIILVCSVLYLSIYYVLKFKNKGK